MLPSVYGKNLRGLQNMLNYTTCFTGTIKKVHSLLKLLEANSPSKVASNNVMNHVEAILKLKPT